MLKRHQAENDIILARISTIEEKLTHVKACGDQPKLDAALSLLKEIRTLLLMQKPGAGSAEKEN